MIRRRSLALAVALAAGTAALVPAAGTATASPRAACATKTGKSITGTIVGADGKGLNAFIGFDLTDANGKKVNAADGCPIVTYGARVHLNPKLSAKGAKLGGGVTKSFTIAGLPANAKTLYAEVYLENPDGSHAFSSYGWTVRQQVKIGASGVKLTLVAPLVKDTGAIKVVLNRKPTDVLGFSQEASTSATSPGWAVANPVAGSGGKVWLLPALAAGQPYIVLVGGGHLIANVKVAKGKTTTVHESF